MCNIIIISDCNLYNLLFFIQTIKATKMDGADSEGENFDATFVETPAILEKYKAAAGVAEGKYSKKDENDGDDILVTRQKRNERVF